MRVRHYGFLANAVRKKCLEVIHQLLGRLKGVEIVQKKTQSKALVDKSEQPCPLCRQGIMHITAVRSPRTFH